MNNVPPHPDEPRPPAVHIMRCLGLGEHYSREQTLAYHLTHLPEGATWYADPSGSRDIIELRSAKLLIYEGHNERPSGIAAVRARLAEGALKVVAGACPNLLAEASLYRYDPAAGQNLEIPLKEHDHAMDALRYLVSTIDARRLGRRRKQAEKPKAPAPPPKEEPQRDPNERRRLGLKDLEDWGLTEE